MLIIYIRGEDKCVEYYSLVSLPVFIIMRDIMETFSKDILKVILNVRQKFKYLVFKMRRNV